MQSLKRGDMVTKKRLSIFLIGVLILAFGFACNKSGNSTTATIGTTGQTTGTGSTATSNYIGNKNTKIFHKPACSYLPNTENRVYINSYSEATSAGYSPCSYCKPGL